MGTSPGALLRFMKEVNDMAYCLEKHVVQKDGKTSRGIWRRYAVCGSPKLLERVRMGQKNPEHWRVTLESAVPLTLMKKAG